MISQLRPGMDLTRVTLPTFVLEPKSMLERITNFMSHPELLLQIPTVEDPEKRFIEVVRFYLSGFHILPPVSSQINSLIVGCKKTVESYSRRTLHLQMEI
jgi:oxysterol-binding protein-related protein 8